MLFFINPAYWLKLVNPIDYKINTVKTQINKETIDLKFEVILSSSYFLDFVMDSVAYKIYFDSTQFSSGSQNLNTAFSKNSSDTIFLPLTIDREKLKSKMNSVENGDSTTLKIEFKNYIDLPLTGKNCFTFNFEKNISAPQPPQLSVISVKKEKLKLHDAIYNIDFSLYNPNNYSFTVKSIDADIDFPDLFTGRANVYYPINVKPKSTAYFTARVDIDNLQLVKDGLKIAFRPNKEWDFSIVANVQIQKADSTNMDITVSTTGKKKLLGNH